MGTGQRRRGAWSGFPASKNSPGCLHRELVTSGFCLGTGLAALTLLQGYCAGLSDPLRGSRLPQTDR